METTLKSWSKVKTSHTLSVVVSSTMTLMLGWVRLRVRVRVDRVRVRYRV